MFLSLQRLRVLSGRSSSSSTALSVPDIDEPELEQNQEVGKGSKRADENGTFD